MIIKTIAKVAVVILSILVVSITGLLAYSGAFNRLDTASFVIPQTQYSEWNAVFSHPTHATVTTLKTGTIGMPLAYLLDRENPKIAEKYFNDAHRVPVLSHLIHHPIAGDFLVDSGFDSSFAGTTSGNYSAMMSLFTYMGNIRQNQEPGGDLMSQLKIATPSARINKVFLTHLHADHTAGIPSLTNYVEIVFGKKEINTVGKATIGSNFSGKRNLRTIDFSGAKTMAPFGPAIDLFGDGSFWAISTPGHTPDHISYLINAESGPILLVGDACHVKMALELGIAPKGLSNSETIKSRQSLEQLISFSEQYPGVKLIFGHDLQDSPINAHTSERAMIR